MNLTLTPGTRVCLPSQPDWGVGQVQSAIGSKVTVNFPDQGKVVLDASRVEIVVVDGP